MNTTIMMDYLVQLEKERQLFHKYTLIDTGKMPSENFNIKLAPRLTKKAQDYGFPLKIMNMICSLDETNRNIIRINQTWEMINSNSEEITVFNTMSLHIINSANAHIIHDIRRFIDDIISIHWILSQTEIVTEVKMCGLGPYLSDANRVYNPFDSFRDFLMLINDIENAYKHSIANNMSTLIGRDEPYIFALYSKNNKNFFHPQLIQVPLKELIVQFNKFYKTSFLLLENVDK